MAWPALLAAGLTTAATLGYDAYQKGKQRKRDKRQSRVTNNTRPSGGQVGNPLTGYEAQTQQLPRLSPEQIAFQNKLLPGLADQLGNDTSDFEPIAQKTRADFNKYTAPSLASRFASFGGGTSSDAYQNALGSGYGELESSIGALRAEHGLKRRALQQNLAGTLLNPTYENLYMPATGGFLGGVAQSAAPALGQLGVEALSNYLNRPSKSGTANPSSRNQQVLDYLNSEKGRAQYTPEQRSLLATKLNQLGGAGTGGSPSETSWGRTALEAGGGAVGGIALGSLINYLRNRG